MDFSRFLMARLQTKRIQAATNLKQIKEALATTPKDLWVMYTDTISRINAQPEWRSQLGMRVLSWLSHSKRNMQVEELRHALAAYPHDGAEGSAHHLDLDNLVPAGLLIDVCAGLVIIEVESRIVTLVHPTTQEYLIQNRTNLFGDADLEISRTCLNYLSFDLFEREGPSMSDIGLQIRLREHPFLDYAARFWGDHVRDRPDRELHNLIIAWLRKDTCLASSTQIIHLPKFRQHKYSQNYPKMMSALQTAAYFGLNHTTKFLLRDSADTATDRKDRARSLYWAASKGYVETTRLLLEHGADISARSRIKFATAIRRSVVSYLILKKRETQTDSSGLTLAAIHGAAYYGQDPQDYNDSWEGDSHYSPALERAVIEGHLPIMRLLLDRGADVNASGTQGHTLLQIAVARGHENVVNLLHAKGANVNAAAGHCGTALTMAIKFDRHQLVEMLLDEGAEVNATGVASGGTWPLALWVAVSRDDLRLVKLLICRGADVNINSFDCPPLQIACFSGKYHMVQSLLEAGANINAKGGRYGTALMAAAWGHNDSVVKLLLENGGDTNARVSLYGNALVEAAGAGNENVVRSLLENGADPNARVPPYCNALMVAAATGDLSIVKLLFEHGANVNAQLKPWCSALMAAAGHGCENIVRLLLENGAIVESRRQSKDSAQTAAAGDSIDAIVRTLLEEGANGRDRTEDYMTMLEASSEGEESVVRFILSKGVSIDDNAMKAALRRRNINVVEVFLDRGIAIDLGGEDRVEMTQSILETNNETFLRFLLRHGLDICLADDQGRIAIHRSGLLFMIGLSKPLLKLLQELKALEPSLKDKQGRTILHHAAAAGSISWVRQLLRTGYEPNILDSDGWAPLHWACKGHNGKMSVEVVGQLLLEGADISILTHQGLSPLQIAATHNNDKILSLLLSSDSSNGTEGLSDAVAIQLERFMTDYPAQEPTSANCDGCAQVSHPRTQVPASHTAADNSRRSTSLS